MIDYIPVNIWDDYYEDGYVPEEEIQETYAYIEDSSIPHEMTNVFLDKLMSFISNNLDCSGFSMELFFYQSKLRYPQWVGTEMESMLFDRWELRFKNLTHKRREELVEELNNGKLSLNNTPFKIYSES